MKLRFGATLRAAYWPSLEQLSDREVSLGNISVTFKFSDNKVDERKKFLEIPIEIDIPQIQVYKTRLNAQIQAIQGRKFRLDPYADKESFQRAYSIAAYVADVLQNQLYFCELLEESVVPINYIAETEDDKQLLNNSRIKRQFSFDLGAYQIGDINIDFQAFNRYWKHQEFIYIKAHALRLRDPISAYRELYRALDYAIKMLPKVYVKPTEDDRKSNIEKEDLVLAKHTEHKYKPEDFRDLRILRDRCSHAFENFITHGKLEDIDKIKEAMPKLKEIVEILERKLLNL